MDSLLYTGYCSLHLTDAEYNEIYTENKLSTYSLYENEYLGIIKKDGTIDDRFCYQDGKLRRIIFSTMSNQYTGEYKPRNSEQMYVFDMLKDKRSTVKLLTGKAGTGKTLLLAVAALEAIEKGNYERIVWVRNNVQVKNTDQLGALPGTVFEKLLPYVGPFIDHVGGMEGLQRLMNERKFEIEPLAYIRGRSIKNSIIFVTEAENLTKEHIKLLLSRVDEGSTIWFDADCDQRDRAVFENSAGVESMITDLMGDPLFGYVHLVKTERSATARLAEKIV